MQNSLPVLDSYIFIYLRYLFMPITYFEFFTALRGILLISVSASSLSSGLNLASTITFGFIILLKLIFFLGLK